MHTDTINPATILVLANETAEADELLDVIERSAGGEANVLVVAPGAQLAPAALGERRGRAPATSPRSASSAASSSCTARASTRPG